MALWLLELLSLRRADWVLIANNLSLLWSTALLGLVASSSPMPPLRTWTGDFNNPF